MLVTRLSARRRARRRVLPLGLLAVGVLVFAAVRRDASAPTAWTVLDVLLYLAVAVLAAGMGLLGTELERRADRRVAASLDRRVSRGTAVPVRTMLGGVRVAFVVTAAACHLGYAAMLLNRRSGWVSVSFVLGMALVWGVILLAVRRSVTAATVAVDPVSLAIDERLRSEQAFAAISPLFMSAFALQPAAIVTRTGWGDALLGLFLLGIPAMFVAASVVAPWSWRRPRWPLTERRSPGGGRSGQGAGELL